MKTDLNAEKPVLHLNNQHKNGYNFSVLTQKWEDLRQYVFTNEHGTETIDFSIPEAVKALNKALLLTYYNIKYWDIPEHYLCPPIPGRADYLHYIGDLLATSNGGKIPHGEHIMGLDVGIGANCIYPILGNALFEWSFVGTDIDEDALANCMKILDENPHLADVVSLHIQPFSRYIFKDVILPEDRFAFTICNPPFHTSAEEAQEAASRKVSNLQGIKTINPTLNFGGKNTELWFEGGELAFITQMIFESARYPLNCFWFTSLVSKKENLKSFYKTLNKVNVADVKTIEMAQGNKISRFIAWTFLSPKQQSAWKFTP